MWRASANVQPKLSRYGRHPLYAVAQARRCPVLRLRSARTERQDAASVTRLKTAEEHECHSPGVLRKICIRYVGDYEQSCPTEPAAQPSACCTAPSWPQSGAACVCTEERRLCNPLTVNREWQNWSSDGTFFTVIGWSCLGNNTKLFNLRYFGHLLNKYKSCKEG